MNREPCSAAYGEQKITNSLEKIPSWNCFPVGVALYSLNLFKKKKKNPLTYFVKERSDIFFFLFPSLVPTVKIFFGGCPASGL